VSNEFPQFIPDGKSVLSDYLYLFCIRDSTIRAVNAASTGSAAVSRNRFKEEDFLNCELSLPPLTEQKAIVTRWREAQDEIIAARERVEKRKTEIDAQFYADLGLTSAEQTKRPKCLAVSWKDFLRWGVSFNQLNQTGADITKGKYLVAALDSVLDLVQYGTSEKANSNSDGVAIIRMNNIVEGQFDLSNLKHLQLSKTETEKLLLKEGDILFNRTNSKELVGKCAVFHAEGEYVFASYLIRVRADSKKADPDFLAYVINSPIGRQQINALSRQIIGQANVNSEELRGLQIPLPPVSMQKQIMERVASGRAEIARERAAADRLAQEITADVEAMILGTKSVKG
jgi:restriction endonuclease S subunit